MEKDKISITQVVKIFTVAISASIIRLVPSVLSIMSKQASWVCPIVALLFNAFDMYIVTKLFTKPKYNKKVENINDVFEQVYGKVFGKILIAIYIVWLFILLAVQTRFFGERIIASTFLYAPIQIFIVSILGMIYICSRSRIYNLAKFCEITFIMFILIAIFIAVVCPSNIDIRNFLPVTIYDTVPILKGTFIIVSMFSMGWFVLFFGEEIKEKETLFKKGFWAGLVFCMLCLLMIVSTIGLFGDKLTSAFVQPFFMAIKKVNIFNSIENIESIFISVWMIADFAVLTFLVYMISYATKNLIVSDKKHMFVTPIIFITYILIFMLADNYFALTRFTGDIVMLVSFALCYIFPIITYIIALIKFRNKRAT